MQAAPHIETVDEPPESPRESKRMTDAEIEIVDEIPEEAPFDPVSLGAARRRTAGAGTALGACLHGWLGAIRGAALGGSCGLGLSLILTLFLAENTEPFNPAYALPFYAFLWISWLVIGMTIGAWRASRWALRRTWLKFDQGTSRIHPNKRCQRRKMHLLLVSPLMLAMLLLTLPFELTASAQVREILRRCQLFAMAWFFHDNTMPRFYCARAGVERTEASGVGEGQGVRRRLDEQDVLAMPTWWKRWGEEPFAAAAALVDAMNPSERARFVQGVGWTGWNLDNGYYVGSILGVPRQVSLSPICPICHPHFPHLSHPVSPHISPQAFARFDDQAGRGVNPHAGQRPGFSHHGWRDKSCSGHRMALAPRCGRHVGRAAH